MDGNGEDGYVDLESIGGGDEAGEPLVFTDAVSPARRKCAPRAATLPEYQERLVAETERILSEAVAKKTEGTAGRALEELFVNLSAPLSAQLRATLRLPGGRSSIICGR